MCGVSGEKSTGRPGTPFGDVIAAHRAEQARIAAIPKNPPGCGVPGRAIMIIRLDVTDLSAQERDNLAGELTVQGEHSDGNGFDDDSGHPDAPVIDLWIEQ